jgi:hypothetical protein
MEIKSGDDDSRISQLDNGLHPTWMGAVFNLIYVQSIIWSWLAHYQAEYLLGREHYLRINPKLNFPMMLDDSQPRHLDGLKNIASIGGDHYDFLERHFKPAS